MHTAFVNFEGIIFYFHFFKWYYFFVPFIAPCEVSKPLCEVQISGPQLFLFIWLVPIYSSQQFLHITVADHGEANMYSSVQSWTVYITGRPGGGSVPVQIIKSTVIYNFQLSEEMYLYLFSWLVTNLTDTNASYFHPIYYFRPLKWSTYNLLKCFRIFLIYRNYYSK